MKFIIFGTKEVCNAYKKYFDPQDILCHVDNDVSKRGTTIDGKPVMFPDEADYLMADHIVIMVLETQRAAEQLIELGVRREKIIYYYQLASLFHVPFEIHTGLGTQSAEEWLNNNKAKRIFICAHEFSRTGVPVASMHLADLLKRMGYSILYGALRGGNLTHELEEKNIDYIVNVGITEGHKGFQNFLNEFDMILFGTIAVARYGASLDFFRKPIIWWINESYAEAFERHRLPKHKDNFHYFADGNVIEKCFKHIIRKEK